MRSWLVLSALLVSGCPAESHRLFVDVVTDYVPGRNFTVVRTEIWRGGDTDTMRDVRSIERDVFADDSFLDGVRAAEITDVAAGTMSLRVSLLTDDGRRIAERTAIVHVSGDVGATVLITRDCARVSCPPAGEPNLTSCVGGRCVAPECLPESPDACETTTDAGVPTDGGDVPTDGGVGPMTGDCTSDSDCTPPVDCARVRCVAGLCLSAPDDALCAAGEICDVASGCVAQPSCGDLSCDAAESYCECPFDCDDRCGGGCCTGSDIGDTGDDPPPEDPPPPPPPGTPPGPGECVVQCCDGLTTTMTMADANECRLDYERCFGHGYVLTMEFEGFRIYTRTKSCFFCCALCEHRLRYHRVEGVISGCTLAADDYCRGTRGDLVDADWRNCAP